ncbi:NAD(P)/FAD-dependent oxidoreductase [Nitrosococcus watsonii]|uniref:HI0933 family protein n=1 Tax=Nitrosococcus watsoni (strain C-113) TaxID=105559 RepID=D8K8R2_NITWC|nr:NAD(P)/FAD-dependent oxidoreductase [Nitrosococcus watsonii]ADJ27122.1 HI0933 family protein [Nitrosococcus watsonii C-113]
MPLWDVVIIGGGAAGLMCAIEAGKRRRRVLLIEHSNRVGKKILMSGGGRCNFTNLHVMPDNFLSANPHFFKSALARYSPWDFIAMVERHGIAYHEKESGQLFCDQSSKLIVNMLVAECRQAGVRIEVGCKITTVEHTSPGFTLKTSLGAVQASALVVASGGLSIPKMGASGFGYELAKQFGHRILVTRPALVPLTFTEEDLEQYRDLSGIGLLVGVRCSNQYFVGGMLLTHRGISGPAILQISSYWQLSDELEINLLPGADVLAWLTERQRSRPGAELKTVLAEWLPKRLAQRLCELAFGSLPLRQYSPLELRVVAEQLQYWRFYPKGTEGYRTAEVTLGGVNTDELSSVTMASKKVSGLYFIGEVVDVTGHLGGFNFQWAWASGHAAGRAI